eukprot:scaffold193631_cov32-Tisochrysis_lutea.AAC.4
MARCSRSRIRQLRRGSKARAPYCYQESEIAIGGVQLGEHGPKAIRGSRSATCEAGEANAWRSAHHSGISSPSLSMDPSHCTRTRMLSKRSPRNLGACSSSYETSESSFCDKALSSCMASSAMISPLSTTDDISLSPPRPSPPALPC